MPKYINFYISNELFGIDVLVVQEIIFLSEFRITIIPNAPKFLKGIINLRGLIVPLIDLRAKLNLSMSEDSDESRIIICKLDETKKIGVQVDSLSTVMEIPADSIDPMRSETTIIDPKHILGVYKGLDSLVVLIDIKNLIRDPQESAEPGQEAQPA